MDYRTMEVLQENNLLLQEIVEGIREEKKKQADQAPEKPKK